MSWSVDDDLNWRRVVTSVTRVNSDDRWGGAVPCTARYVRTANDTFVLAHSILYCDVMVCYVQMVYERRYQLVRNVWLISTLLTLATAMSRVTFVVPAEVTSTLTLSITAMELSASCTLHACLAHTHSTSSLVVNQCQKDSLHSRFVQWKYADNSLSYKYDSIVL